MMRLTWKMDDGRLFIFTIVGMIIWMMSAIFFALAVHPTLIQLCLFSFIGLVLWFIISLMVNSLFSIH